MVKTITIDGREVKLAANAATPFRFRQMFKKDILQILGNEEKAEAEKAVVRLWNIGKVVSSERGE